MILLPYMLSYVSKRCLQLERTSKLNSFHYLDIVSFSADNKSLRNIPAFDHAPFQDKEMYWLIFILALFNDLKYEIPRLRHFLVLLKLSSRLQFFWKRFLQQHAHMTPILLIVLISIYVWLFKRDMCKIVMQYPN